MGGESTLRTAIVGCGAVAQDGYLPACLDIPNVQVTHVVDVNEERARTVAREFDVPESAADHRDVLSDVDAAIVTTPPEFHASIARDCFDQDVHVLTEKPIATSPAEAAETVAEAERRRLHYAVTRTRRHFPSIYLMKRLVDCGCPGDVRRFEYEEGRELAWEFRSGYRFDPDLSWGGVVADMGPHVFDLLQWYFGRSLSLERYADDSLGGVEGNAELTLTVGDDDPVDGRIELSHTRTLDNRLTIYGDGGRLVASLGHPEHEQSVESVYFYPAEGDGDRIVVEAENLGNCSTKWQTRLQYQIDAFADSVLTGDVRYAPASDGIPVVDLIAECYENQAVTPHPWERVKAVEVAPDGEGDVA